MKYGFRKWIASGLIVAMSLSLAACGAENGVPPLEERIDVLKSGEITFEEMQQKGWVDEEFTAWMEENTVSAAPMGPETIPAPAPIPVSAQYVYEYMGLSYTLPEQLNDMLRDGSAWMHYEASIQENNVIDYSLMYYALVPEEQQGKEVPVQMIKYEKWLANTQRVGTIGIFDAEFLKNNPIETLTKCDSNTEIGKTSDGRYVFYLSTNSDLNEYAELFKQSDVTTSDPAEAPAVDFNILGAPRAAVSDLGDFTATNLEGEEITPDIFADYDLTLINLWTTTCGYCIEEMPYLEELRNQMQTDGKKFNVIGMCLDINKGGEINDKKLDKAKEIAEATGIQFETLIPDEILWKGRLKGIDAFPESFFVDRNGKIVGETILGAQSKENWQKIIEEELDNISK